jgi:CubicO group peptidase (beta-lactamase class C family)
MVDSSDLFTMKTRTLARLALLLVLVSCTLLSARGQPGILQGFDNYVTKALRDWGIPGAAVVIVKDDSVVLCRGYGVRRLGEQVPIDEHTMFGIASCSKAFTAASLAMLVDEGKITWDDPVVKHLPWFQLYDPYVTREITIRDLLTHRCGLPAYGGDLMWWGSTRSREEILRRVRFVRPTSSFRTRYAYHNIMVVAAGQIIPAVTGTSWEDFVSARIFLPLGMSSSTTSSSALVGSTNVVSPHMRVGGVVRPIAWRNVDNGGPAGAINSKDRDLAQWIRLQLGCGTYQGKQLFSPEASRAMWSPQTIIPIGLPSSSDAEPLPHFRAYGLGWGLYDYRGRKILRHFGETDGMSSLVALVPEDHLGFAILTNMHVTTMHKALMYRIFDLYLGGPVKDWSTAFLNAEREQERLTKQKRQELERARTRGTALSLPIQRYLGNYENDVYGTATVEEENGKLLVRLRTTPSAIGDLAHWQFDTFEATWRDPVFETGFVIFTPDGQGNIDHMSLRVADYIEPSAYIFRKVASVPSSSP